MKLSEMTKEEKVRGLLDIISELEQERDALKDAIKKSIGTTETLIKRNELIDIGYQHAVETISNMTNELSTLRKENELLKRAISDALVHIRAGVCEPNARVILKAAMDLTDSE